MSSADKKRTGTFDFSFIIIFAGLLVAQIVSTLHVYHSNLHLYQVIEAIHDAGYLAIPNLQTLPPLKSPGAAFWGGLFFTLSIGAGLSLSAFAAAWLWINLFGRNRFILVFLALISAGFIYGVNQNGFSPFASLYFILIPPVVFLFAVKRLIQKTRQTNFLIRLVPVYPIVLLAFFWSTQLDSGLFVSIRDNILLSNPIGIKINDFYYRYTLYPAEAFKSPAQKTLRTCDLSKIADSPIYARVERQLRNYDYLAVKNQDDPDLTVREENSRLIFTQSGREVFQTGAAAFVSRPKVLLEKFSEKIDRLSFFRSVTYYCIKYAYPIFLYLIIYSVLHLMCGFCFRTTTASVVAAGLSLAIGITAIIPVYLGNRTTVDGDNLRKTITSENWQDRVAAVKYVEAKGLEISEFPTYKKMLTSPHLPERYWSARALAVSRKAETFNDLLKLMDDSQPNVVCQALYALGKRGNKKAIAGIISTLNSSTSWYIQRYGYNALRALGWKQPESK